MQAELARRNLLDYARFVGSTPQEAYETPEHIQRLAAELERVERGELKRLMVNMPPRHGKSMLVSQLFPCWYLGRNPRDKVVQTGYALDIALEHSRFARDFFVSEENRLTFHDVMHAPERASQDPIPVRQQAAQQWGTVQGGRYRAVGVGGGLTGFGADLAIIDDPVKGPEDAESHRLSQAVWDWYRSVLRTRLSPKGAIVLVMTRWAVNDLAGRLLDQMRDEEGDEWEILSLPAIDSKGNALWPERFPLHKLEKEREIQGAHSWSALYMQEPVVRGGNMFCTDRIVVHDDADEFPDTRHVRFWDLASTKKERAKDSPDYTVGALCGLTTEGQMRDLWIKDLVAVQSEAPERNARIITTANVDGPSVPVAVESVAGYKDTYTTLAGLLKGKRTVHKVNVSGDKVVRAAPIEPIMEAGRFHILRAEWNRLLLEHFSWFPSGPHDDCVDAVSGALGYLSKPAPQFIDRGVLGI